MTATFNDYDTPGSVVLTMDTDNLTGNEYVGKWYFNFEDDIELPSFTLSTDPPTTNVTVDRNRFEAAGGGKFDIEILFRNADGLRFGPDITSTSVTFFGSGFDAESFNFLSDPPGGKGLGGNGTYHTAAHVQSIGSAGESGWIGDTTNPVNPVPEPATFLLLGVGLVGLAGFGRKKLIKYK